MARPNTPTERTPLLIAHRAGNCLPRLTEAREVSPDLIEADVHLFSGRLEVRHMGWAEFSDALDARTVPAFLLGWVADLTDPDGFVRSLVETASSGNYLGFSDEETDRLLAEAR